MILKKAKKINGILKLFIRSMLYIKTEDNYE